MGIYYFFFSFFSPPVCLSVYLFFPLTHTHIPSLTSMYTSMDLASMDFLSLTNSHSHWHTHAHTPTDANYPTFGAPSSNWNLVFIDGKYQLKSRKWRRLCVEMRPRIEELCGLESADFQSCGCRVMQCWRSPSSVWSSCPKVAATICLPAVFTFWHWLMMIWISPPVSLPPTPSVETRLWSFYPRTIPLPFWGVRNPSPDVRSGAPKSGWNGWGETVRGVRERQKDLGEGVNRGGLLRMAADSCHCCHGHAVLYR